MNSNERALRAMRAQAQFEVVQAAAEVAAATAQTTDVQRQVTAAESCCEALASELRGAMARSSINPPLVAALRRLYRTGRHDLSGVRSRLATAERREQEARAVLAAARNYDRTLERALEAERRKLDSKRQAQEIVRMDDLWLQHSWRVSQ